MAKLFYSYSHLDEALRNELDIHVESLVKEKIVENWHDRRIEAGNEFDDEISSQLEEAQIILLLISPYFIASEYCYEKEMKRAMEIHEARTARVIPVILKPCNWHNLPFGKLTALPCDGKPVTGFSNQDEAFYEITLGIASVAKEVSERTESEGASSDTNQPQKDQETTPTKLPDYDSSILARFSFGDLIEEQKKSMRDSTIVAIAVLILGFIITIYIFVLDLDKATEQQMQPLFKLGPTVFCISIAVIFGAISMRCRSRIANYLMLQRNLPNLEPNEQKKILSEFVTVVFRKTVKVV